jgi:ferritin-like protein
MNETAEIWPRIAERLTQIQPKFPADEVALAAARWDEVAPHLIGELEQAAADPSAACEPGYMLHLFAMFLAAQQRDVRAHAAIARLTHLPDEVLEDLFGDLLTDGVGRCLASTCGGDETAIRALIEDEGASIWARYAGFEALATRVLEGDIPPKHMLDYLASLGAAEEARLDGDPERSPDFLTGIVNAALDVGAAPMLDDICRWFAKDLIDETSVDLDFVERHAHDDLETLVQFGTPYRYVRSAIDEMKSWAWDTHSRPVPPPHADPYVNRYGEPAQAPLVHATPKVGRNDPCPCGSGKKYKKCCGAS